MRLIDADALKEMKFSGGMLGDNCIVHVPFREVVENIDKAPTVGGWISVKDRLPENAKHEGALCPRYLVKTKYGVTEGWYNPDHECWYVLLWFLYGFNTEDDINLECGDKPGVSDIVDVTHWMPLPELLEVSDDDA